MEVLKKAHGKSGSKDNVTKVNVLGSNEVLEINCEQQGWNTLSTWTKLNGVHPIDTGFAHSNNESYISWNKNDGRWWMDGPDGNSVWIADGPKHAPPAHG